MKCQGKEVRFCQIVLRLGMLLRKFFAANKKISFDTNGCKSFFSCLNMKRKRTPSPILRRSSRSPCSPRSTRASNRTPPRNKTQSLSPNCDDKGFINGSSEIRRSLRARRSSYQNFHVDDNQSRARSSSKEKKKSLRSRSSSPDTEEMDSPFFNHVRFSPSAKPGSPARWQRHTQRAAASIARMRLQNVPSEDEQQEFNRRYSRDLRSRRGVKGKVEQLINIQQINT